MPKVRHVYNFIPQLIALFCLFVCFVLFVYLMYIFRPSVFLLKINISLMKIDSTTEELGLYPPRMRVQFLLSI